MAVETVPVTEHRWRPRVWAAAAVRVLVFLIPPAVGVLAGTGVASVLPDPASTFDVVVWWILVIGTSTAAATLTDRAARRLLPLAVLLEMTMLFPDRAPSRLTVARRAGSPTELRRRVQAAAEGGDRDLGESAELILSLAAAISHHDRRTRGHVERTRAYSELIAVEMGLAEADRDRLRWAALLHDVGKLEVPAEILNKDGPLDADEWEIVKMHPVLGMGLIEPLIPWLGDWAQTIEHHHERWDGSGYPHGLAGTDINLGARIVAVADAYDVMTSGRSYQRRMTPAAARREVVRHAGSQFDPTVARALMTVSLGKLRWATGPLAVLAEIPFLGGIERVGRDVITVATSSAVMATALVTGAVNLPQAIDPEPVTRAVLAQAALDPGPATPGTEASREPGPAGSDPSRAVTAPAPPLTNDPPVTATTLPPVTPAPSSPGTTPVTGPGTTATPPPAVTPAPGVTTTTATTTTTTPPTTVTTVPPPSAPTTTLPPAAPTTTTTAPPPPPPPPPPPTTTTTTAPPTTTPPTTVPPSGPPVATADDQIEIRAGRNWVRIAVLRNDSGDLVPETLAVVAPPLHGDAETRGGSGSIWYRPDAGFTGSDSLVYEVCDTSGACATGTVDVTVR